jgi:hypothetical protein
MSQYFALVTVVPRSKYCSKDRPLGVPKHCQNELSGRELLLEFFGCRRCVLPLYALPFGFWFIMMNQGFIPSDDAIKEVFTFKIVPLEKKGADVQAVALMLFCQMFGHPPCRFFWDPRLSCTKE